MTNLTTTTTVKALDTKTIRFWVSPKYNSDKLIPIQRAESGCPERHDIVAYAIDLEVDFSKLTPASRFIAERIGTTLRSGSGVRAFSRKSEEQLMREAGRSEAHIQKITAVYGPLAQPWMDYDFGMLPDSVTPENFMNEKAEHLARIATHITINKQTNKQTFRFN